MPEPDSSRTKILKTALEHRVHPESPLRLRLDPRLMRLAFNPPWYIRWAMRIGSLGRRSSR